MVAEDLSEETSLLEAERKAYWRKNAMKALLGAMIAHEDKYGRAITQEEIVATYRYPEVDTEKLLHEMLDYSYVAYWIDQGAKEERGDTMIIIICNAWGTTFFGRDWFRNDNQGRNEKNVHFYFAEHPI
jgi:hypothetical protein